MNKEKKIWESATKVVFLGISAALIGFTAAGIVSGENFFTITATVFAFYFGQKTNKVVEASQEVAQ